MKMHGAFIALLISMLAAISSFAQAEIVTGPGGKSVDIAPLVALLKSRVKILKAPVMTYHYIRGEGSEGWMKRLQ